MPLTKIIRMQAMLSYAGLTKPDGPFDDQQIVTSCPCCGMVQTLADAPVRLQAGQTRYRCKNGCGDVAAISEATPEHRSRGYHLGDYVLCNGSDVFIMVGRNVLQVPAAHKIASRPKAAGTTVPPRR